MKRNVKLDTREFVCPHIFDEYGEDAVMFVDEKLVEALTWLKENFYKDHEIFCNEYNLEAGDRTTVRSITHHGMICNKCALSVAHTFKLEVFATDQVLGKAVILKFVLNNQVRKADEIVSELTKLSPGASEAAFRITVPIYARKLTDELVFLSVKEDRTGGDLITQLNVTPEEQVKLRKRIIRYTNSVYSGDGYSGNYGQYSGTANTTWNATSINGVAIPESVRHNQKMGKCPSKFVEGVTAASKETGVPVNFYIAFGFLESAWRDVKGSTYQGYFGQKAREGGIGTIFQQAKGSIVNIYHNAVKSSRRYRLNDSADILAWCYLCHNAGVEGAKLMLNSLNGTLRHSNMVDYRHAAEVYARRYFNHSEDKRSIINEKTLSIPKAYYVAAQLT